MDEILSREQLQDAAKCREKSACKFCNNYAMALESCCILTCIEASAKTALHWQDKSEEQDKELDEQGKLIDTLADNNEVLEKVLAQAREILVQIRDSKLDIAKELGALTVSAMYAAIAKIDGLEVGKE